MTLAHLKLKMYMLCYLPVKSWLLVVWSAHARAATVRTRVHELHELSKFCSLNIGKADDWPIISILDYFRQSLNVARANLFYDWLFFKQAHVAPLRRPRMPTNADRDTLDIVLAHMAAIVGNTRRMTWCWR